MNKWKIGPNFEGGFFLLMDGGSEIRNLSFCFRPRYRCLKRMGEPDSSNSPGHNVASCVAYLVERGLSLIHDS